MAVNTYKNTDSTQLSAHYNVQEFRCKCGGTHDILISSELIDKLELLYTALDCSKIIVTSGYRCPTHDKAVGGTSTGQHTKGTAADICCYGQDGKPISSKLVCCKAQDLGFTGIANIDSSYQYTHVDVRNTGYRWLGDEVYGNGTVTDDFYSYYNISKNADFETSSGILGIDVSYAQGKIDWEKVKASGKVDFAILRAGYGREYSQVDEQFARNYSECKRLGIPIGVYWYSYATTVAEAKQEARACLKVIAGKTFEYPVYFDIEEPSQFALGKKVCSDIVQAFCDEIEKAGYYVGLYCSTHYLANYISESVRNRYAIWCAQYNDSCTYSGNYGIWQSGTGKIYGIDGDCDIDHSYIDYEKIIKNAGLNGFSSQNSNIENEKSDKSDNSDNGNTDTLEQILEHVANIDKNLQNSVLTDNEKYDTI